MKDREPGALGRCRDDEIGDVCTAVLTALGEQPLHLDRAVEQAS